MPTSYSQTFVRLYTFSRFPKFLILQSYIFAIDMNSSNDNAIAIECLHLKAIRKNEKATRLLKRIERDKKESAEHDEGLIATEEV